MRAKATHQRSILNPLGREELAFVATGNKIASRVALLIWYSLASCCRFLLEQPRGSAAELHPRLVELWKSFPILKVGIWGGAYADDKSASTPKRHWMYSNDDGLLRRLALAAGSLSKATLGEFKGAPTMKKERKGPCEKDSYTGVKKTWKPVRALATSQCNFSWLHRVFDWVQLKHGCDSVSS